ncbi:hypothetical protein Tco_0727510 [Tanacetum coccineum]|uniref:Uncharacterized protein n=1 Tax=Tanacetum coccineum TaxID=301880 RepID=A0ABQ4YIJ3_9ASTR
MVAVEVLQTREYRGGQLNATPILEVEIFTDWKKRYKALMNDLVNDDIKISKLEKNTGFINGLPMKWLSFCQSLRNTNHVKDSELASLFAKLKCEENLIEFMRLKRTNLLSPQHLCQLPSSLPLLSRTFKIVLMMKRIGNGYLRKGQKPSQNGQNRARNGKA